MSKVTVKSLKAICKKNGVKGYSKMKKPELLRRCKAQVNKTVVEYKKKSPVKNYTIKQLKDMCKKKGIKGYSKMKKSELMKHCFVKKPAKKVVKKVVKKAAESFTLEKYIKASDSDLRYVNDAIYNNLLTDIEVKSLAVWWENVVGNERGKITTSSYFYDLKREAAVNFIKKIHNIFTQGMRPYMNLPKTKRNKEAKGLLKTIKTTINAAFKEKPLKMGAAYQADLYNYIVKTKYNDSLYQGNIPRPKKKSSPPLQSN